MADDAMDGGAEANAEWIKRLLGVTIGGPVAPAGASAASPLLPIWTDAKDALDARIANLQRAVRGTRHPLGAAIANRGLAGVTRNTMTPVIAALFDHDRADPASRPVAAEKLRAAAVRLRQRVLTGWVFGFEFRVALDRQPSGDPLVPRHRTAIRLPDHLEGRQHGTQGSGAWHRSGPRQERPPPFHHAPARLQ